MDMSLISAQSTASAPGGSGLWPDMKRIAASVDPVFARQAEEDLDCLARAGVTDYDDLLLLPSDQAATLRAREVAIWMLSRLPDLRGTGAILIALHDDIAAIRAAAAKALGDVTGQFAAAAIPDLESLLTDPAQDVRRAALYALGMLGGEDQIATIVKVLEDRGQKAALRGVAAEALADIRSETALPALRAALADPAAELRYWSAFALGEIGEVGDLARLSRIASRDDGLSADGNRVDLQAAHTIARIENRATRQFLGRFENGAFQPWRPQLDQRELALAATSSTAVEPGNPPPKLRDVPPDALVLISGYRIGATIYNAQVLGSFDAGGPRAGGQADA